MVGGGRDAFIGAVHRMAARLDDRCELVAGALSADPEKARLSGLDLGLDPARVYADFGEMARAEKARADGIEAAVIVTPNHLHYPAARAFLAAGIDIICDKPLSVTMAEAYELMKMVRQSKLVFAVTLNNTGYAMVRQAREMIAAGELGAVTHARFRLFSDYAAHPEGALTWRYERERGGSGVLGDLASHGVDLARHLLGEIEAVVADSAIFVAERARPAGATAGHARATGGELGAVENEDYVGALLRFASGARGVLEASRIAVGEQNNYGFEVHGTRGAVFWDFRRMNELGVSTGDAYQDQAVSAIYVGPAHGDFAAFQPGAAIAMGYDDLKVIEAHNFLRSIADGTPHGTTLRDAVRSGAALDAMARSAETGAWVEVAAP
jgi:predicted dehydrogenase